MTQTNRSSAELDAEECWRLLRAENLGRLAVVGTAGAEIFPLNYLVHDNDLYFRTAPGSKLEALARNPEAAFEIDGRSRRRVWSVIARGVAQPVTDAEQVAWSGVSRMPTDLPGEKHHYLAMVAPEVTGRSFVGTRRPWDVRSIVIVGVIIAALAAALGLLGQQLGI